MTFRPTATDQFLADVFEKSKAKIRAFSGCRHMELLQHETEPNVLFTLSFWENAAALEAYRNSDLFLETWKKTKALFEKKAEAWSVVVIDEPPI